MFGLAHRSVGRVFCANECLRNHVSGDDGEILRALLRVRSSETS